MLFIIILCIVSGFVLLLWGRFAKNIFPYILTILPLGSFIWFLSKIPEVKSAGYYTETFQWVPQLGINFSFRLDGLSLIFALMISGIGALVFWYTSSYLKGHRYLERFYMYLSIFMAAMLGMVLADNLITLFIFWELTSISSFFLIGFNNEEGPSRKSALTALLITGSGGFLLLAGIVLLGIVSGTYDISAMLSQRDMIVNSGFYPVIAILFFFAAFTKSAQFPFHFWLPGAMKAPTPVSTYLHSATMVKAGVYLLLRFTPLLGNTDLWNQTLTIVGGITMVYAAVTVIYKSDLKAILAYTTVASLGIMIFLIGLGTDAAILAAVTFIITHALYKAALFLITGIIDHETGTRDINQLAGLRHVLMPVAIAGFAAAIVSGGVPPSFGFISKDLIYEASLNSNASIIITAAAVVTNIFLFYGGFAAGVRPFTGKLPERFQKVHLPAASMWVPPLILSLLGVLFGLVPGVVENNLLKPAIAFLTQNFDYHIKLWHGFNQVLLLSAITIVGGLFLFFMVRSTGKIQHFVNRYNPFTPEQVFQNVVQFLKTSARSITRIVQNGYLRKYVFVTMAFMLALLLYVIFNHFSIKLDPENFGTLTLYEFTIVAIMMVAIITTLASRSRLVSVSALGILGFSICSIFVFYSAPDLAMTQFSVDILTVILFVFVLFRMPKILKQHKDGPRISGMILATMFGATITFICLKILNEPINTEVSDFYSANAYTMAKGKNIVNVLLVDFRGIDTLIEICVLIVAALGVYSLLKISLKESY